MSEKTGLEGASKKLHEIWRQAKENMTREIRIGSFCITNGWVNYSKDGPEKDLCDNPECSSCTFKKAWFK